MDNFRIEGNKLFVDFEPINELSEMSKQCYYLLDSEHKNIEIYFSDTVFFLSSNYIGVLMMTAAIAKIRKKSLRISCTNRLARMLTIIGGSTLMLTVIEDGALAFDIREDFIEDTSSYKDLSNNNSSS